MIRALSTAARSMAALLVLTLFAAESAHAEDWLAVLPPCALAARGSVPSFALLYPRPGLPAVLAAGDTLYARVRLPAPLTPPPGIQQARALEGWRAELIGHADAWPPQANAGANQQHQALAVVNVRPDSAQSLVYRAALPLPAWLAPGSYDLTLIAPSGRGTARASVRVIEQARSVRLAFYGGPLPQASPAVRALPIDVFVRSAEAPAADAELAGAGIPILDLSGLVAALRVENRLWVIGACEAVESFDDEVRGVLDHERRARLQLEPRVAQGLFQLRDGSAHALPEPDAVRVAIEGDSMRIQVAPEFPGEAELALALRNDGRGIAVSGARFALHPGAELEPAPAWLVAALRVPAGVKASLSRRAVGAPLHAQLSATPRRVNSLAPVRFRVTGLSPRARVAWRLDARRTAFGPAALEARFGPLGSHHVLAWAVDTDGRNALLHAAAVVQTEQASGCHCSLVHRTRSSPPWFVWFGSGLASVAILPKRKKLGAGRSRNRLRGELG